MQTIVFFDGVCNLCNRSVNFLIRHDKKGILKFVSLQSAFAKNTLPKSLLYSEALDSIVVYTEGKYYKKSSAVLKLCKTLGGFFYVFQLGYLLPPFLRNGVYALIANNRYRWFGTTAQCSVPKADVKDRFLD
ncbi:MAG: DCC1-like thiol-disulfide oxidoreductase family protein [Flavobacteriaceae bacterium]|nr:DCC1-like thiol-disulfide oxidoreductase family protein [Flavobacteriaceae bacterium]